MEDLLIIVVDKEKACESYSHFISGNFISKSFGFITMFTVPKEKVRELVNSKITELGVVKGDKAVMGKLMGAVIKASNGEADGAVVKKIVEEVLI